MKLNGFKKGVIALCVMLVLLLSAGAVSASDVSWYDANETEFTLTTADQLYGFAEIVNTNVDNFTGKTVKLGNDIVLNDETFTFDETTGLIKVTDGAHTSYVGSGVAGTLEGEWDSEYAGELHDFMPIGSRSLSTSFKGTFDGCNYAVKGLYINITNATNNGINYCGFFGYAQEATIKNLKVVNAFLDCVYPTANCNHGMLLAECRAANFLEISKCYAQGIIITQRGNIGALTGMLDALSDGTLYVNNCSSDFILSSNLTLGGQQAGVVAFEKDNGGNISVTDCHVTGKMYNGKYTGGMVAYCGSKSLFARCSMTGEIINSNGFTGGIIGVTAKSDIVTDCYSNVRIDGGDNTAGITGSSGILTNCYATGSITEYATTVLGGLTCYSGSHSNCLNLMEFLSCPATTMRIGASGASFNNNYAWESMLVNGELVTDGTLTNANGSNIDSTSVWNNQSFFESLGWDFTNVWKMNTDGDYSLPVLRSQAEVKGNATYLAPVKVTFDSCGGSNVSAHYVSAGMNTTKPADPTKNGYVLENWYKEATCINVFDFNDSIYAPITLYANWSAKEFNVSVVNLSAQYPSEIPLISIDFTNDSNVSAVAFKYEAPMGAPSQSGATITTIYDPFTLRPTGDLNGTKATVVFNVSAGYDRSIIHLAHYVNGAWTFMKPTDSGNFSAVVDSMSPFAIVTYIPPATPSSPQQYYSSSGSGRQSGGSVILMETVAPTVAPTIAPTPLPTPTFPTTVETPVKTPASPLPVLGIIAGLALALLRKP